MIKAAIIGCGNIAGGLDTPEDDKILTHAHALLAHPQTELIACCDTDAAQRERFRAQWGEAITGYGNLNTMLAQESPALVSLCTTTPSHAAILQQLLTDETVEAIICEKPLVQTVEELDALEAALAKSGKKLVVNYMRRFDPSLLEALRYVQSGAYGNALSFSGRFTKGLYHNGSHMLELIEHLFGPLRRFASVKHRMDEGDAFGIFYLETAPCSGTIANTSGEHYALFELEIVFERGRIKIEESGHRITMESVQPSRRYIGYHNLEKERTLPDTLAHNALHTVEYAVNVLHGIQTPFSHLAFSRRLIEIRDAMRENRAALTWSN